jgi:hypothetical protein
VRFPARSFNEMDFPEFEGRVKSGAVVPIMVGNGERIHTREVLLTSYFKQTVRNKDS